MLPLFNKIYVYVGAIDVEFQRRHHGVLTSAT